MNVETRFLKYNIFMAFHRNMCAIKPLKQQGSQVESIYVLGNGAVSALGCVLSDHLKPQTIALGANRLRHLAQQDPDFWCKMLCALEHQI